VVVRQALNRKGKIRAPSYFGQAETELGLGLSSTQKKLEKAYLISFFALTFS